MKKINNLFILPLLAVVLLSGCEKFLGETPDKSGSSMIYHMDQLKEMTSNPELFMYNSYAISAANQGWCASYMQELSYLSDAVSYEPEYFVKAMKSSEARIMISTLSNPLSLHSSPLWLYMDSRIQ